MNEWFCYASGQRYGPITQDELGLWIQQGRVKPTDLVWRDGMPEWQEARAVPELASLFVVMPPAVPIAPYTGARHLAPHRGTTILVFGILGLLCCIIFAIVAWVMANEDLQRMALGQMDPSGRDLTKAGKVLGQISVGLSILGVVFYALAAIISI